MKLLAQTPPVELPSDALLARLRCRRANIDLVSKAQTPQSQAPELLQSHLVSWVYRHLNARLKQQLEPYLDLLAMRSLILMLRYTMAGEAPPAKAMGYSLLVESLQRLARTAADAEATVAQLEALLINDYPFIAGLTATYRHQGPGGLEQQLTDGILQHGLARAGNELLKETLGYLIDMRNCLMVSKLWRWQVIQAPPLIAGGKIATSSLERVWATHDNNRLARLISRLAGEPLPSTEAVGVEQCLLSGLTRFLQRAGRDPLGLAVIIEYLWRAQLASHNRLLQQTLVPDRKELFEEVLLL